MGESSGADLQVPFERRVRLQFQGAKVSLDAGLLAVRELDEALKLSVFTEIAVAALPGHEQYYGSFRCPSDALSRDTTQGAVDAATVERKKQRGRKVSCPAASRGLYVPALGLGAARRPLRCA